jgi:GNAT superfamily N-acetyltransferase
VVDLGAAAARRAWARLAGLDELEGVRVVVGATPPFGRPGWIAILALDGTVTAAVPRPELVDPVVAALAGLDPAQATTPGVVRPRMPPTRAVLGPAALFYPPAGFQQSVATGVEVVAATDVRGLLGVVAADELAESGLAEVTGPVVVARGAGGGIAAACGYRVWPNGVAHLSVLADPRHRRRGHARRAATTAIARALEEGLLPQWRARVPASQALARTLGLVEMGAQLGLEPADRPV